MEDLAERYLGPGFRGRRFLRVAELIAIGLVPNRQTLRYWIANDQFPRPIQMGKRIPLFPVADVVEFVDSRREVQP